AEVARRFCERPLPARLMTDLVHIVEAVTEPLAVRSSSLLEDSQHQPFTGVYETLMLRNNAWSLAERLEAAIRAIKRVFASTFMQHTKAYLKATPYRLEEEKMAVMLQRIVGAPHGSLFYPDFSGVLRTHNFYPSPPMTADDGIAAVALGMGRAVVEGDACLRFSPRYPQHILEFASTEDMLATTQREFWALSMDADRGVDAMREQSFGLEIAERDGTLDLVGSTYSPENDIVYDGVARSGPKLVTFAPVLKLEMFPLAEILRSLKEVGSEGMGSPVEIEFAVNTRRAPDRPQEFGFLQMRPLALFRETELLDLDEIDRTHALCWSSQVLGNGQVDGIRDLVVVDFQRFERARSHEAALEVGRLNGLLLASKTPYILIGVGRWGSRDPWLGIPVNWEQVSGAQVIIEAGLRDLKVTPSQGTHFFQNLTSFNVGYFTVNPINGEGFVDWDWLDAQRALSEQAHVRHLQLDQPVVVKMSGRTGDGVILKPA
ncbi:MAG: histidine kinase, partial [Acidobacteriota bacterium]